MAETILDFSNNRQPCCKCSAPPFGKCNQLKSCNLNVSVQTLMDGKTTGVPELTCQTVQTETLNYTYP